MYATHFNPTVERGSTLRRGVVAVKVALLLPVLFGFVALGVDVGLMFNARQELQRAADASALAAVGTLAQSGSVANSRALAQAAAVDCALLNDVVGEPLTLIVPDDVEFGQAERKAVGQPFTFSPNVSPMNAVRVTGRRTEGAPDGPIPLYFAAIFGRSFSEWTATATAMMRPRDIAIVADLSNSHNNDSELRQIQSVLINLHEVWAGTFPRGDWPGWSNDDPQAQGWGWGFFKERGRGFGYDSRFQPSVEVDYPDRYDPRFDVGLVHMEYSLPRNGRIHWDPSNRDYADIQKYLKNRPIPYQGEFSEDGSEIQYILGDFAEDRGKRKKNWRNRVAVATGFADWNSGIDDEDAWWRRKGLESKGNGDSTLDDKEMIWDRTKLGGRSPDEMEAIWREYTDYVARRSSTMSNSRYGGVADFRWRFGIKTFMNFLMDKRPTHADTPEFANAPIQPMLSVKQAVEELVTTMSTQQRDQLSLEVYGTTARHLVDLGPNLQDVSDQLNQLQAGHWDGYTNIAGGIRLGREQLTGPNARPSARKVIVLLTDGRPTAYEDVDSNGNIIERFGARSSVIEEGKKRALVEAELARDQRIRIYAISVGSDADQDFMQLLVDVTRGRQFRAQGTIDQYSDQLRQIFATIADIRPVTLVK